MAQVLKEEIRENIWGAALEEFYEKGYKPAAMRAIAGKAGIPTGLIYSYYENKEALFDAVLAPVNYDWDAVLSGEDENHGHGAGGLSQAERRCLMALMDHRKEFIILMDKSQGTKYENKKEELISRIGEHLSVQLPQGEYDPVFLHIVANNFVEGLLQIMYHYKNREWAADMLNKISNMCFRGIGL